MKNKKLSVIIRSLISEDILMTFSFMAAITIIIQFIFGVLEYKYPKSLTNGRLIKRLIPLFLLSALALLEYVMTGSHYLTYFLGVCLALLFIISLGEICKYFQVRRLSKREADFNTNTTEALFYLNWKIKNFCSTDQVSNTFFFKQDDLIIFFGEPDSSFKAMDKTKLQLFKDSLTQSTMGHIKFGGFLVIKNKDDYISLSSDELKMLNVPITKINQETFKAIEMLKI